MSNIHDRIRALVQKVESAFSAGQFENFIDYIRFPRYKNLEDDAKIDFCFPLVILTGQNGSGKSSALHAIQGSPAYSSPTKFWFSTKVDPIEEGNGKRTALIYGYKDNTGAPIEVIKTRIADKKYGRELDLWETSRPIIEYGMKKLPRGKRNPPIQKDVVYFDFRAELSSYDKFFYFGDFSKTKTLQSKQDYIRKYSPILRRIIDNDSIETFNKKIKNDKPFILGNEELKVVNRILSKDYSECKIIRHSLFKNDGVSVYFKTNSIAYSDAFAGRGEFAVVKIVNEIMNSPKNCLVVLDEPEVSLHPGAQQELKAFLLEQTLKKKLQVVISTHSPSFVEDLPEKAIKLFYATPTGKFAVKDKTHQQEAFLVMGHETGTKAKIYVEDKLAESLMSAIINSLEAGFKLLFDVVYFPGGAKELYKNAAKYALENEKNKFLLLDGDEFRQKRDPNLLTKGEMENFSCLNDILRSTTGINFSNLGFQIDSFGSQSNEQQKIDSAISYIDFIWTNLDYLPNNCNPEQLIWNEESANRLLLAHNLQTQEFADSPKENFRIFCELVYGSLTKEYMQSTHQTFIKDFCQRKDSNYEGIVRIIGSFKTRL